MSFMTSLRNFRDVGKGGALHQLLDQLAHAKGGCFEAAVDRLVDKLERVVERERDKKVHEPRRRAQSAPPPEPVPVEEIEQALRSER